MKSMKSKRNKWNIALFTGLASSKHYFTSRRVGMPGQGSRVRDISIPNVAPGSVRCYGSKYRYTDSCHATPSIWGKCVGVSLCCDWQLVPYAGLIGLVLLRISDSNRPLRTSWGYWSFRMETRRIFKQRVLFVASALASLAFLIMRVSQHSDCY